MNRTPLALLVAACALALPAAAIAETTAVVVGGDPGKRPAVVDAISPWLQGKAQSIVLDALPEGDVGRLVDCFLTDDERCATSMVAGAGVDRLVFVMVQVNEAGDVQLSGWLFRGDGSALSTDHQACPDCRVETLTRTAEQLIAKLWQAVEPAVTLHVTSTPPGASVAVDGAAVGATPLDHEIAAGAHEVTIALADYRTATRRIAPVAGSTQAIDVALVRGGRSRSKLPWIVIGAGAAAMLGGAVLVAMDEDVPPLDPSGPEPKSYFDSGLAGVSMLGLGALVVGGGVYLWLREARATEATGVVLGATAHGGAIGWQGRF